MRVETGSSAYQPRQTSAVMGASTAAPSAPNEVSGPDGTTAKFVKSDFTGMTRQQLFDWMNNQLRSGAMSMDESTAFLAMTVKIDARTGASVDMQTDSESINFMQRAARGIEGAQSRGEQDSAARLSAALSLMQRYQGQLTSVDMRA